MLLRPSRIIKAIKKVLRREGVKNAQLSLTFVTRQRMQALNKKYLNHPYATDVLAFDFLPSKRIQRSRHSKEVSGEVVVSSEAACQQARRLGVKKEQELVLYIVHGVLHLLGFDDHCPKDIKRFRAKEKEVLRSLSI